MTDKLEQDRNNNSDCITESKKRVPSRIDFLIEENDIYFDQFSLFDCGFLRGNTSKIRFFNSNISDEVKISPVVNGKFIESKDFPKKIEELEKWNRLYIEVFDSEKLGYSSFPDKKFK